MIVASVFGVALVVSVLVGLKFYKTCTNSFESKEVEELNISILEVNKEDFDNHFDRSPGRYCKYCEAHGSHHSDKHNEFAKAVLLKIAAA